MRLPRLLPWGIGAGAMFALSMLGEHVVSHNIHHGKVFALVVFGTFFVTLFTGGAFATRATRRMTTGALTGLWTALIVSELWVLSLYWVYLSFVGTPLEARFLNVDQTIADFERSGQADLRAFSFGDYTGAAFFPSLLEVARTEKATTAFAAVAFLNMMCLSFAREFSVPQTSRSLREIQAGLVGTGAGDLEVEMGLVLPRHVAHHGNTIVLSQRQQPVSGGHSA